MAKHRFYCEDLAAIPLPDADSAAQPVYVSVMGEEARHARRVLRLDIGDEVEVFDGISRLARGRIASFEAGMRVAVDAMQEVPLERVRVELAVALPKGPRCDDMLNQLSQLGISQVTPLHSARSVVDPRPKKLDRFRAAAIASAKQSGRDHLMTIAEPQDFAHILTQVAEVRLIAAPAGVTIPIAQLQQQIHAAKRVLILIGPEGGWTEEELQQADACGWKKWNLGPHILRIETAAVAAAAICKYVACD